MKRTDKKISARIERAYSRTCSGVQIPIMKIGEVFAAGERAIAAGADDAALEAVIVGFVQMIRSN